MKNIKSILLIFLIIFTCLLLPSCKKEFSYDDLDTISYEDIFNYDSNYYIIVCWQTNCVNCDKLKESVEKYYNYCKEHKRATKMFGLNVNLPNNKDIVLTEGNYPYMIGTNDYNKIKIKTTPTILVISDGFLIGNISDYTTNIPVTQGKAFIESLIR